MFMSGLLRCLSSSSSSVSLSSSTTPAYLVKNFNGCYFLASWLAVGHHLPFPLWLYVATYFLVLCFAMGRLLESLLVLEQILHLLSVVSMLLPVLWPWGYPVSLPPRGNVLIFFIKTQNGLVWLVLVFMSNTYSIIELNTYFLAEMRYRTHITCVNLLM